MACPAWVLVDDPLLVASSGATLASSRLFGTTHCVVPPLHSSPHSPPEHTIPFAHDVAQSPQCSGSVFTDVHTCLSSISQMSWSLAQRF